MCKRHTMFGFIYKTTNLINNKIYVGLCTHENPILSEGKIYLGSGKIIKQAVKRYGKNNFQRDILQICYSLEELLQAEIEWIEKLNPDYNIELGGRAGISSRMKDYWAQFTADERKEIRNWGRKSSVAGENNPMYGRSTSSTVKETWDRRDSIYRENFGKKVSESRKILGLAQGKNNPMYGRSAIREKNLKWYTDGISNKYITEGTEPEGYKRGRTVRKKNENYRNTI